MRQTILLIALSISFGGIIILFYYQDFQYSLPTPVPQDYKSVAVGQLVTARGFDSSLLSGPLFLHFYNPDCPCSRFNSSHLKSLIAKYRDSVRLFIVVPSMNARNQAIKDFGKDQRYVVDSKGALAALYGVYATPQAVLVDRENKLFFRGNYNKSRYCSVNASNYAELALITLLNNQPPPRFELSATQTYGCELPVNERRIQLSF